MCPGPGVCTGTGVSVNPVYGCSHNGSSSSITAALVCTGTKLGLQHQNKLLYADFSKKWIRKLTCTSGYSSCGSEETFMTDVGGTTRLAQGPDGSLYQLTIDGKLWRIAPVPTGV